MKLFFVLLVGIVLLSGCGRAPVSESMGSTAQRASHYISHNPAGLQQ